MSLFVDEDRGKSIKSIQRLKYLCSILALCLSRRLFLFHDFIKESNPGRLSRIIYNYPWQFFGHSQPRILHFKLLRLFALQSCHLRFLDDSLLPTGIAFEEIEKLCLSQYLTGQQADNFGINVRVIDPQIHRLFMENLLCPLFAMTVARVLTLQLLRQIFRHCYIFPVLVISTEQNV